MFEDFLNQIQAQYRAYIPTDTDRIFSLIREFAGTNKTIKLSDVMAFCTSKGYKPEQVNKCIDDYAELNVWEFNQTRTRLTFI